MGTDEDGEDSMRGKTLNRGHTMNRMLRMLRDALLLWMAFEILLLGLTWGRLEKESRHRIRQMENVRSEVMERLQDHEEERRQTERDRCIGSLEN